MNNIYKKINRNKILVYKIKLINYLKKQTLYFIF